MVRAAGSSEYNFKNPVRRDVLTPGQPDDIVTIRFRTDNPGPWIFHCHIDWHLEHGLAIVFAEDIDEIADKDIVNCKGASSSLPFLADWLTDSCSTAEWSDLCPLYDQFNPDKHFDY